VRRDERQLLNGLSQFRDHASRSNGYEANSSDGARNLQMAVAGSIAWRQAFLENGDRWRGDEAIEDQFSAPVLIVWIGFAWRSLKIAAERGPFTPAPVFVCCGSR
jgi:hypothetical protein